MTNLPNMSKRAAQALEVLADGGRFVRRLERDSYTGREQFRYRLVRTPGAWSAVKGVGLAAFYELQGLGLLQYAASESTSVTEPFKLRAS